MPVPKKVADRISGGLKKFKSVAQICVIGLAGWVNAIGAARSEDVWLTAAGKRVVGVPIRSAYDADKKEMVYQFRAPDDSLISVAASSFSEDTRESLSDAIRRHAKREKDRIAAERRLEAAKVPEQRKPQADPKVGFRGLAWGSPPLNEMKFVGKVEGDNGGEGYQLRSENLGFWNNQATKVVYVYGSNKLENVNVTFENQKDLLDDLRRAYGPPKHFHSPKGNGGMSIWETTDTTILFIGPLAGPAVLVYTARN